MKRVQNILLGAGNRIRNALIEFIREEEAIGTVELILILVGYSIRYVLR